MKALNLKPTHRAVRDYYEGLGRFEFHKAEYEMAVKEPFKALLSHCAKQFRWTFIPEYKIHRAGHTPVSVGGALVDEFNLPRGYWEAKDSADDLAKEAEEKFAAGYPRDNILFQQPERAMLFQNGDLVSDENIDDEGRLVHILKRFFEYSPPNVLGWEEAISEFRERVPELGRGLLSLIRDERGGGDGGKNDRFKEAFARFMGLCRQSINPNLSENAVEEMLIQHLLTERVFGTVFKNPDFARRNVIAVEIEKVVDALMSGAFDRGDFLKNFDHFYTAIENAASSIDDFTTKQAFLNRVYEKFFRGFSVKAADTNGIVYTPQPIVDFMVASVEEILRNEFGRSLDDEGVHVLDPFVGTGSFIVNVMRRISPARLEYKYRNELHANEVMLLPYYAASTNIEHEYFERMGEYLPFEGICLVDTFELAEPLDQREFSFMTEENTERVERQKKAPIFVIISNPPYNSSQVKENDDDKNRAYPEVDKRVSETYSRASKAQLLSKLQDPYVKAVRWATDRIGGEGIVAYVTNNSFVDDIAFDGMRKHLAEDFDSIYVLDLGGNVRKNPKLSGVTHNVFGLQYGVSVNLFVKKRERKLSSVPNIFYAALDEYRRREEKYRFLETKGEIGGIDWQAVIPNKSYIWLTEDLKSDFYGLMPLGTREAKRDRKKAEEEIFTSYSLGVATNRDEWVYKTRKDDLEAQVQGLIANYNSEVSRYRDYGAPVDVDDFVNTDPKFMKWTDRLKLALQHHDTMDFNREKIRHSIYRPFAKRYLYFDRLLNQRWYNQHKIFPTPQTEKENIAICVSGVGSSKPFQCLIVSAIPCLDVLEKTQCFPFYVYDEDGTNRRENISDNALEGFRRHYRDDSITKWDVFYYAYAVLHHKDYSERYHANLKRELPRVPFAPEFKPLAAAGRELAELHIEYEDQDEFELEEQFNYGSPFSWRVERMRLNKEKTRLRYNNALTLAGIPEEVCRYRLGNRSALEWVIYQYRVKTDKRSGITDDPNSTDDPQYIYRLIKKVITVSLRTVEIVDSLPSLGVSAS